MTWSRRSFSTGIVVASLLLMIVGSQRVQAQGTAKPAAPIHTDLGEGHRIAEVYCSSCHGIGRSDRSRHPPAPPFRELSKRYPIDSLAESLAEGISVGHPDMPEFQLEPEQIHNFLSYLKSIQVGRKSRAVAPKLPFDEGVASFGRAYAEHACSSCHAIAPTQTRSPNPKAPAFASVANTPGMNVMALRAWLRTSHPTMPNLIVDPDRVDDLSAYISTLRKGN